LSYLKAAAADVRQPSNDSGDCPARSGERQTGVIAEQLSETLAPPYSALMDGTVFISFASKDRGFATKICESLEQRGIGCWIAVRDIGPGENFQSAVFDAIDSAKVMVLVFSENAHYSDEVKKEIVLAGQCRLTVIPVRIEDVRPHGAFAYELATRQWVDLFEDWEGSVQRLIEQIVKVTGQESIPIRPPVLPVVPGEPAGQEPQSTALLQRAAVAPEAPVAQPAAATPSWKNRLLLIGASVVALAIVGIAGTVWFGTGGLGPKPLANTAPNPSTVADALAKAKAALDRKDYVEAMRWYQIAGAQNSGTALTHVGYLYERGLGVPQDYAEAMRWYRKAADRGHAAAQRDVGNLYQQGAGVPQDYAEAMRWYQLAAAQGNAAAQTNIGYLYEKALGTPQNYVEAMRWYRMAADQGEPTAQNNIGVFYDNGYGVPQNYGEAIRWYEKAANQGNIDAEYNLALLFADGHGVPTNLDEARHWMQKAADAGDPQAKVWLSLH
jgi:TPR repeat protein